MKYIAAGLTRACSLSSRVRYPDGMTGRTSEANDRNVQFQVVPDRVRSREAVPASVLTHNGHVHGEIVPIHSWHNEIK